MVNSQARRLVPGWNLSMLVQALTMVSCTRSSAEAPSRVSDSAKARRAGRWLTSSSRGSALAAPAWREVELLTVMRSLLPFQLFQQVEEPIGDFRLGHLLIDAAQVFVDLLLDG